MLLTITSTGPDAAGLGYLLHKNPERPQMFELSFGKAYVFYPETEETRCTAALLLDIDPLDLARGKAGSKGGGLFDYVNDRPYVSSSFMSVALASVYGTAMKGRCEARQALADSPLELSAAVTALPCRGDAAMLERVFSPLGYSVEYTTEVLDEQYPDWGAGRYVNLIIRGRVRLKELLTHLYVLIPVFDRQKHYWVGMEEVDKLLRVGEGWLERHPEKEFIVSRYLSRRRGLTRMALERLDDGESGAAEETAKAGEEREAGEETEKFTALNEQRLQAVVAALRGSESVIDMGCGNGNLLRLLLKEKQFARIAGTDVSLAALEWAKRRLNFDTLPEALKNRLTLFQSALTYEDDRYGGYEAAAVVEVIEHLDPGRLSAFERVLFARAHPKKVVLTTPNVEYNEKYKNLSEDGLRHGDHRFEWTREQFREWAGGVAERYGYSIAYSEIGGKDEERGSPTEMGVFTVCE
ncbi:MAG: 3' terminal RNA ribose 2'-O-methyltransferase Hen1 [Synergistaceae bacterium]|nr:3' terminal RNA ribose 2'-O-methyltransferase Hen1 [Synergistaceae bacterium]